MTNPAIEAAQLAQSPPESETRLSGRPAGVPDTIQFTLNSPDSAQRKRLENFIADRFNAAYGAAIVEFFPLLLSRCNGGKLSSVVGLRPGTERPLFLEQYLDSTLEKAIARCSGQPVTRTGLMEIGNLASSYRSGNQFMFMLLTAVLERAGYDWVVFTATAQVRALLTRLDFHPLTLCQASQSRLLNKQQVWGSYYLSQPMVQAGSISEGMDVLRANRFASSLIASHEAEIDQLAAQLIELRHCRPTR